MAVICRTTLSSCPLNTILTADAINVLLTFVCSLYAPVFRRSDMSCFSKQLPSKRIFKHIFIYKVATRKKITGNIRRGKTRRIALISVVIDRIFVSYNIKIHFFCL